jgi:Fe-S cluster assembly protein SufD
MTLTASQLRFDQAGFDSFLAAREEPQWLSDLRRSAWQTFCELDWPARRSEEWMRTDIRMFKLDKFAPTPELPGELILPKGLLAEGVELGGSTVSLNGLSMTSELSESVSRQGVIFGSLEAVMREHGDLLRPHFMTKAFRPDYDRFAALHAAFWSAGTVLYVPKAVAVKQPLHALSLLGEAGVDMTHTLVILEDDAEATLLSETASLSEQAGGMHCGGIELLVGKNARLRYVSLQNWGEKVWHFSHQKALVDRDASLQWTAGALGAKLAKVNQGVELIGEGAESQVNGVMFTENKQHLAYHTQQHHRAPHCRSDFLYKTALQDRSHTVWRGMIKVDHGAQKTDGYQRNDNLLLSNRCRADSIPGLEINADDVRCTHGSTSGRVDEELIFYACCRGFTRKEAIRMIVTGFFQQVFDRITIDSVRDALGHAIASRVRDYE